MDDFFSGMTVDEKRAALKQAQNAYLDLSTGKSVASAKYAQAGNGREVTYRAIDMVNLTMLITSLQISLGIRSRRRAMGIR